MNPRDPDAELVRACQKPDDDAFEAAFEALYRRYRDRVYSIAYRITGNATDAMDVVQESFSLLFRKIDGFRHDASFGTWLFRIVVNCSIDQMRAQASRNAATSLSQEGELADDQLVDPVTSAHTSELGDRVHEALQRLSPKLRAILALRYLEGMSYEQLRQALCISMGTVKSRLARAHLALERVLRGSPTLYGLPESEEGVVA